ncbi:MAG TPA: hypothetical protein DCS28_03355 [Candidatus Moranbacteria bacterium]|nr:hypothetical protein [Candidatus Moranbacteria bacterium]HAT75049.1 hypothetical protein [Candidatus Moranbacteria bacterium]
MEIEKNPVSSADGEMAKETVKTNCCERMKCNCEKVKKFLPQIIVALLLIIIAGGFGYYKLVWKKHNLTQMEAKTKVTDFINNNLIQEGMKAEIGSVTKENGMFKVIVKIGEGKQQQEITSYLSLDGTKFFPNAMDIAETEQKITEQKKAQAEAVPVAEITKADKPTVELFVMSYCPYGTQIEKGILPVIDALGAKIDYTLKFVNYAMHEKKEIDENLKQYCIQKNEPAKLSAYLKCFLKDSAKSETCSKSIGINAAKLSGCVAEADKQFKITEQYNDKGSWSNGTFPPFDVNKSDNEKYGVKGSPTLVINGVEASAAGRDSASLLKTICSGFKTEPKECSAKLSAIVPSAGFGEGTASVGNADAACGN